jgi:hypothetical protein
LDSEALKRQIKTHIETIAILQESGKKNRLRKSGQGDGSGQSPVLRDQEVQNVLVGLGESMMQHGVVPDAAVDLAQAEVELDFSSLHQGTQYDFDLGTNEAVPIPEFPPEDLPRERILNVWDARHLNSISGTIYPPWGRGYEVRALDPSLQYNVISVACLSEIGLRIEPRIKGDWFWLNPGRSPYMESRGLVSFPWSSENSRLSREVRRLVLTTV